MSISSITSSSAASQLAYIGKIAPQGGPGKLAEDLGSLIAKLGSSTDGSTGSLESSFGKLLTALSADSSDAASQLGSFLQALAGGMPEARTSGNLINATA